MSCFADIYQGGATARDFWTIVPTVFQVCPSALVVLFHRAQFEVSTKAVKLEDLPKVFSCRMFRLLLPPPKKKRNVSLLFCHQTTKWLEECVSLFLWAAKCQEKNSNFERHTCLHQKLGNGVKLPWLSSTVQNDTSCQDSNQSRKFGKQERPWFGHV